eukprot:GILJ01006854.1.p1 GENE.GILJ01006854.1~~GILJ01006854.1.p1  ORF type:complete len:467 (+),score=80.83 GILJ01006854.1:94-1494(+)
MSKVYFDAADVINGLVQRKGGLKTLCFGGDIAQKKKVYALVCETMKKKEILDQVLEDVKLFERESELSNKHLVLVMLFDMLFGKGIHGGGVIKKTLQKYKEELDSSLAAILASRKQANNNNTTDNTTGTQEPLFPRYVRVNTIKTNIAAVETALRSEFKDMEIKRDAHVPNLLVLPNGTDLHDHKLVQSGHIILQDKASCFTALALDPSPGWHVIDACAAPGNKTSHAAAIMNNNGTVFACELNRRRAGILRDRLKQAGASIVRTLNTDFLKTDPNDPKFSRVRGFIVDPSCSGSGMTTHRLLDQAVDRTRDMQKKKKEPETVSDANGQLEDRVMQLSKFQISVLNHALSFPRVQRVAYSTCSIHRQENEDVVNQVLESNPQFNLVHCLPSWPRRGLLYLKARKDVLELIQILIRLVDSLWHASKENRSSCPRSKLNWLLNSFLNRVTNTPLQQITQPKPILSGAN